MDRERAKIELMQIYGSLSSEKQMAIDTLLSASENPNKSEIPTSCDDAISREAVNTLVDELARAISDERCCIPQRGRDTGHIMHDILDLPSVQPSRKGHWIPVSERLPEDGTYLVTIKSITGRGINIRDFAKDLYKVDEFDFPKHKCGWYDYDSEYGYWEDTNVVAWMPLPKSYKADMRGARNE